MIKSVFKTETKRALSFILAVSLLLCSVYFNFTVPVLSASAGSEEFIPYVLLDGERVEDVILNEDAKLRFEAVAKSDDSSYQWQIKDPDSEDRWIKIADGYSKYMWVTHALVGSMLDDFGSAQLRCRVVTDSVESFTEPVKITVSINVDSAIFNSAPVTNSAVVTLNDNESEEPEFKTYSIIINYLFDNNAIAFEPYGATVAAGSDFITDGSAERPHIKSPEVVGYDPYRRVGDEYIEAKYVAFNLINIQEDVVINVIYEPGMVQYAVHHHFQHVLDDDYSVNYDRITYGKALTGSIVGDGLALTEEELPGFKALAYEKLTVAADGSTIIEIRYDRNYYLVDFDMAGGYGTEPVYTRFESTIGANTPVRHGYIFDGWVLNSYGGYAPTTEQQAIYALNEGGTILVPAANLRYKARWITQETNYTMVFWKENADDNGYSYWGYLDNLKAMSGSYVDGQDYISRVSGIDDEQYFTFNKNRTDKHVLVEGDGSTVVNVYYTRNYYKLDFKAAGICTITPGHKHTDSCYDRICGFDHIHSDECVPELKCPTEEHTEHNDDCIICGKEAHIHGSVGCDCTKLEHTHTVKCWDSVNSQQTNVTGAPQKPLEGYIHKSGIRYYIYINGAWYRYTGRGVSNRDIVDSKCGYDSHTHGSDCSCGEEEHEHTDSCYRDTLHTHSSACYKYSCGFGDHTHDENCKRLICGITENHSHGSSCTKSSSTNVVKTVYAKYGQSLKDIWPVKDGNGVVYDSGQRWDPGSTSDTFSNVLVFISKMPPEDFTLTLSAGTTSHKNFTMLYYLQVLPGEEYDVEYEGKHYKLDNTIKAKYNYLTPDEDFFDIAGFVQYESNPAFSNGQIKPSTSSLTVYFYYDRKTDHVLEFNNNGEVLSDKTVSDIMYGAPLKDYNFVPPYPNNLEPNAYTFDGWYISPGCFDGTEVDWDNITSPEGDLMLYAKWAPITHTVRVFLDDKFDVQIGSDQIVDHKAFASAPEGNITNGNYIFQGWFYKDLVNGVWVDKAFAFHGIPVLEDMDIFAKWSSHVSVKYTIHYKLFNSDVEIAETTVGSAIAGHSKTFDAKAGDELYAAYQRGYYPLVNSHTITMSVDGTHEFTFEYVYVESMPYKVQYVYIDPETGNEVKLCDDKIVNDNELSVVTETFKRFDKMMPDAYQKRLVLSADKTDEDNDGIYDANVIKFVYNADEEHAYYRVVHYIQNITGDTYREYRSEDTVGIIGEFYTATALTLTGFEFVPDKTVINGVVTPATGNTVTAKLGADGMLIELYYDRQLFDYTVRYIDSRTRESLYPEKTASDVFGKQIIEYAVDLSSIGYELVVADGYAKTHTISANVEHNVIEFQYQERTVGIRYQIVGSAGCGVLSQYSENLVSISGTPIGSMPYVNKGFMFMGWYLDVDCTVPVNSDWVDSETNRFVPRKTANVWNPATYYAKIISLETDLTITTKSTAVIDKNQAFIFNIKGKEGTDTAHINLNITIIGNDSATITKLPTGNYTISLISDWSWRYENSSAIREVTLEYHDGSNEIIYDNSRENGKWVDGESVKFRLFD